MIAYGLLRFCTPARSHCEGWKLLERHRVETWFDSWAFTETILKQYHSVWLENASSINQRKRMPKFNSCSAFWAWFCNSLETRNQDASQDVWTINARLSLCRQPWKASCQITPHNRSPSFSLLRASSGCKPRNVPEFQTDLLWFVLLHWILAQSQIIQTELQT